VAGQLPAGHSVDLGHGLELLEDLRCGSPRGDVLLAVTRLPSTTTCVVHGAAASNWAPARRRRSSSSQGALPAKVAWVSSSLVKAVSFRPLNSQVPSARWAERNPAGPWHTPPTNLAESPKFAASTSPIDG
jgi:hypothetical protein